MRTWALIAAVAAWLAAASAVPAQSFPGAGSLSPDDAQDAHAWVSVPLKLNPDGAGIVHLPPRGPGVPDGSVRIVGRKATDLIKSGGYKIGAGEIENALLEHPGVREAAVAGEPDTDLGERVAAWIVPSDPQEPPSAEELADHVARRLAPHKRPRTVRFLKDLPRNDMGKVLKRELPRD